MPRRSVLGKHHESFTIGLASGLPSVSRHFQSVSKLAGGFQFSKVIVSAYSFRSLASVFFGAGGLAVQNSGSPAANSFETWDFSGLIA
jgi:hypothetical protein